MSTHHFTKDERIQIKTLKKQGFSLRFIAQELGKNVNSAWGVITKELKQRLCNHIFLGHFLDYFYLKLPNF